MYGGPSAANLLYAFNGEKKTTCDMLIICAKLVKLRGYEHTEVMNFTKISHNFKLLLTKFDKMKKIEIKN